MQQMQPKLSPAPKKAAAAEAQTLVDVACDALRNAKDMQKEGDLPLEVCETRRNEVSAALESLMAESVAENAETIMKVLRNCDASESLLVSMQPILALIPGQRSEFQTIVAKEAERLLSARVSEQTAFLAAGAQEKQQRALAVEDSENARKLAKNTFETANGENLDAEVEHQNAVESLRVAAAAVENFDTTMEPAKLLRNRAKTDLDHFMEYNVASFCHLRNKVSTTDAAPQAGA